MTGRQGLQACSFDHARFFMIRGQPGGKAEKLERDDGFVESHPVLRKAPAEAEPRLTPRY